MKHMPTTTIQTLPLPRPWEPIRLLISLILFAFPLHALKADAAHIASARELNFLKQLSIEELLQLEVTSVSRQPQQVNNSPAAVFVITGEDLRRSGATSFPEALRLVPGLQVARIDNNKWAVSARGFNGRFANKLLVLQDGRRLYNSAYSGVFWDLQDAVLDNVERIEVIRGPGAAVWGTNAVNGVINIITKPAAETQGGLISQLVGTQPQGITEFRYGSTLGETGFWRISGKAQKTAKGETRAQGSGNDGWEIGRIACRMDLEPSTQSAISVQSGIYTGSMDQAVILPSQNTSSLTRRIDETVDKRGGNIRIRLDRKIDNRSDFKIQAYYDRIDHKETVSRFTQDALDIDLQYEISPNSRHNILCGVESRITKTGFNDTEFVTWQKNKETELTLSSFIQDRIVLIPDSLNLTLGLRAECNQVSGCELQPNVRFLWALKPDTSIWLAASRASRMPSIGEREATYLSAYQDTGLPGVPPIPVNVYGNDDLDPEKVDAFELGFRTKLTSTLSMDVSGFYNRYNGLLASKVTQRPLAPPELTPVNGMKAKTYGVEISSIYQATPNWRLQTAFSTIQMDLELENSSYITMARSGDCPRAQASLFSTLDLPHSVEWNLWVKYVDLLPSQAVDAYVTMDTGFSWKARPGLTLSLVGQNLLESEHEEFNSEYLNTLSTTVKRSFYGKVEWKF